VGPQRGKNRWRVIAGIGIPVAREALGPGFVPICRIEILATFLANFEFIERREESGEGTRWWLSPVGLSWLRSRGPARAILKGDTHRLDWITDGRTPQRCDKPLILDQSKGQRRTG